MTTRPRPWTLTAAFPNSTERDTCLTEVTRMLAASPEASSAQIYETEMTDGTPGLGIDHPDQEPLARLLSAIATQYRIRSISLHLGG